MVNDISDKYLLASILQKSIRLGLQETTVDTVEQLYTVDKSYLMYRLMIIAFEDVGIANVQLIKDITRIKWGVRIFQENNINFLDYFKDVAQQLASSNKDRSLCDAVYLVKIAYLNNDFSLLNSNPILSCIYKAWNILGNNRYKLDTVANTSNDNLDDFLLFVEKNKVNNLFTTDDFKNIYKTQVEPFFLALAFLDPSKAKVVKTDIDKSTLLGNIPFSAIDGHTAIGVYALKQYSKRFRENERFSLSPEQFLSLLKMCLFRVEGQAVNPRLVYDDALMIKDIIQKKELNYKFTHILWQDYVELGKKIKADLSIINEIRENKINYEMIQKNKIKP